MIRLYLIRPEADEKLEGRRVLSPRGRRRFRRTARAFADLEEPVDLICTSDRPHARETASILSEALGRDDVVELDELSRRVPAASLLRALARRTRDGAGIALVGRKRQLRELLELLGIRKRELPLRKGCFLRLDVDALPRPRSSIPRFRLRPSAGDPEDAFVGMRKVG